MNETQKQKLDTLILTLTGIRDGKPWEVSRDRTVWRTPDPMTPLRAIAGRYLIRLKPWTLGRTVNGHTLPEGKEWHRGSEFTEADLPEGYRPCMEEEVTAPSDEVWAAGIGPWCRGRSIVKAYGVMPKRRTKRPIIPEGWTPWAGGECPVPRETIVSVIWRGGEMYHSRSAGVWNWDHRGHGGDIIAYRVVESDPIPLGPEDVPPGSVFRSPRNPNLVFISVICVRSHGVLVTEYGFLNFEDLKINGWEICRPSAPGDWVPCHKTPKP